MVLFAVSNCSMHYSTGTFLGPSLIIQFIQEFVHEYNMRTAKTLPTKDLMAEHFDIIYTLILYILLYMV